jgi:CRP/FNR family transcriptional regulator, anaerobic regulatory protein
VNVAGQMMRAHDRKTETLHNDLIFGWFADYRQELADHSQAQLFDEALTKLAAIASTSTLREGETLYLESDNAERCYELLDGCLRLISILPDGTRHVGEFLHRGDLLGFGPQPVHQHTVEAVSDARVLSFPRPAFFKIANENPVLASAINLALAKKADRATQRFRMVACFGAVGRVAIFLLDYARQTGTSLRAVARTAKDGVAARPLVHLPMRRSDIADHIGLSVETVCRAITKLRSMGLIIMPDPHHFMIPSRRRLERFTSDDDQR